VLDPRLPRIPDDWGVWAFADPHGVVSGLVAALREAGLVDADARWVAPPRTALVGCGDYIDRGRGSRGMVRLLRRLSAEAAAAGGAAVFARGTHEQMALLVEQGQHDWMATWLRYGGCATLRSFGCPPEDVSHPGHAVAMMEAGSPGLFAWLASLPQAVRWRDVLFVHGGLPPDHGPEDLGVVTDEHLWIRREFFETAWESGDFGRFVDAGIERVVFGHTPQTAGPTRYHGGRSLAIDTNACGNPALPQGSVKAVTLVGLGGDGSFDAARVVTLPTDGAPDGAGRPGPGDGPGPS
jgi:hypothetical protein